MNDRRRRWPGPWAVASAPGVTGVWEIMSWGWGPRTAHLLPEGANVAYALDRKTVKALAPEESQQFSLNGSF
jgi:hypothetical protein